MKLSRRKALIGLSALPFASKVKAWPRHGRQTGITNFVQGALGGGGYSCELSISDDGQGFISRADTYQANVFNRSTERWDNIYTANKFSGLEWNTGGGVHAAVVAPSDGNRMYVVGLNYFLGLGFNNRGFGRSAVFRSDNGGASWSITGMQGFSGDIAGNRIGGHKIAVDPNNRDIVYAANQAGVFFVTFNGGNDWSLVTPLLAAIGTTTMAENVSAGDTNFKITTNAFTAKINSGRTVYAVYCYNVDHPGFQGQGPLGDQILGLTDNGDGTSSITVGSYPQAPGATSGDTLYIGAYGQVAFDKTTGTVANPGIALSVPGASGVASSVVYFGWGWGATSMWRTLDGGVTFGAMTGGPLQIGRPKVSRDANGGVLYVADNPADLGNGSSGASTSSNMWRWVGATPPAGSGLSANTWTNLTGISSGSGVSCGVPHPTTPGRVVFMTTTDNPANSTNWGTAGGFVNVQIPGATGTDDPPWLRVTGDPFGQNFGDACWDQIVSDKFWHCNGIGVWYTTDVTANPVVWTSRTAGMDTMTTQAMVKAPAPNGNIFVGCQDRPMFVMPNPYTYPTVDHPRADGGTTTISHCGSIVYSRSDPTVMFGAAGSQIWRSADSGANWSLIGANGVNGFISGNGKACIASASPTSIVQAPTPSGGTHVVQYGATSDGGATWTWTTSTYNGADFIASFTFDYGTNAKCLDTDGIGNYYLFDKNSSNVAGGGIFKSADNGATWTLVSQPNLSQFSGNICPVFAIMPGYPNIMVYAPGSGFSPQAFAPTPLKISLNAGVTWADVSSTYQVFQVAFGKSKPGNSYPTIFITGNTQNYPNPLNVYRCDDFSGTTSMTWNVLDNIKFCTGDSSRNLSGDMDTYGSVYVGTGSSGYIYGYLT